MTNRRAFIVLDRDGTINAERHYLSEPDQVELLPGTTQGLRQLRQLGYGLLVVTNQSPIGRGVFDEVRLTQIHARLCQLLSAEGVEIDDIYYCPHTPQDDCRCRKPRAGMIERAINELSLEPELSFVIGDKPCDIELGKNTGIRTILVRTGYGKEHEAALSGIADYVADDLAHAARLIEAERSSDRPTVPAQSEEWARARMIAHLEEGAAVMRKVAASCSEDILHAATVITDTFRRGGKVLLCGNGGSAADCQHMAAEFTSRLTRDFDRPALPAIALTTDTSFLTAYANDVNFDGVFSRQVEALCRPEDTLIGISTSGGSRNVLLAIQSAKERGASTLVLMGEDGPLSYIADVAIRIPSNKTQPIQESHLAVEHILCDLVERLLFGQGNEKRP